MLYYCNHGNTAEIIKHYLCYQMLPRFPNLAIIHLAGVNYSIPALFFAGVAELIHFDIMSLSGCDALIHIGTIHFAWVRLSVFLHFRPALFSIWVRVNSWITPDVQFLIILFTGNESVHELLQLGINLFTCVSRLMNYSNSALFIYPILVWVTPVRHYSLYGCESVHELLQFGIILFTGINYCGSVLFSLPVFTGMNYSSWSLFSLRVWVSSCFFR